MADAIPVMGRGVAPSGPRPLAPADVKFIAVHCSATPPNQNIGVTELRRMHLLRGFTDVGYHFIIRRDGSVETGRAITARGAHVEDYNWCSVGICLVGGVDAKLKPQANFTQVQYEALTGLVTGLLRTFPQAAVKGHRDFPSVAKACPSFDVRHYLATGQVIS